MDLKTYRAKSMAECLAEVKRDLGSDAVILRTRTLRAGGVLGIASKPLVEITASATVPPQAAGASLQARRDRARAIAADAAGEAPSSGDAATAVRTPPPIGKALAPEAELFDRLASPRPPLDPDLSEDSGFRTHAPRRVAAPPARPSARTAPRDPARPPVSVEPPSIETPSRELAIKVGVDPQGPDARTALEAELASIRRLVGQVLQTTRTTAVEVARSGPSAAREAAVLAGGLPDALFNYYTGMLDNAVPAEIADELAQSARAELSPSELADPQIVRQTLLRGLARRLPIASPVRTAKTGEPARTVAFIGPTGVGKTTSIAKLAATLKLKHGRRVGLITADSYRIAAVEQLRTYASIIGVPVKVALSPPEMAQARAAFADCDVILVDTAGRSPGDEQRLGELAAFLEAAEPSETHLVLSASMAERSLARAADRFGRLGPDRLFLSKLDEAEGLGVIVSAAVRTALPIGYVSTGQEVPDDFEPANADRLARLALDGEGTG